MNESIYSLIPPEEPTVERGAMYRSAGKVLKAGPSGMSTVGGVKGVEPPTYSTFPSKRAGEHLVQNTGTDGSGGRLFSKPSAVMGRTVGQDINPSNFLKAHEKHPPLPAPRPIQRSTQLKPRDPVPKSSDPPVMGLKTDKDFVTANAVDAICMQPRNVPVEAKLAIHKKDMGKAPAYLTTMKARLNEEKEWVQSYRNHEEEQHQNTKAQYYRELSEEERQELLAKLRTQQAERSRQIQSLPFSRDTMTQKARRERMEKELDEVEKAIAKLSKEVVYVYKDDPSCKEWCKNGALKEAQETALRRTGQFETLTAKRR